MAVKSDYYQILGVSRNASPEEIRSAFRRLAFQYHPDHNHNHDAEERFKEINQAYQVLSDAERRANYNRSEHPEDKAFGSGFDGFDDLTSGLGNIFEAFFGGITAERRQPQRGSDIYYQLSLSFEEAVFGTDKEIKFVRTENCLRCHGLGSEPGSQPIRCPKCNGYGELKKIERNFFGSFINRITCDYCHGGGTIITQLCSQCHGSGRERKSTKLIISIPPGVDEGNQIRINNEGNAGRWGGPPGNIYLNIVIKEHEFFKREGNDIIYELPINFAQAALGDEVEIPTVEGKTTIEIPPGAETGLIIRLKNKGIPFLNHSGCGDQLVEIRLATPQKLTKEQHRLFQELAKSLGKPTTSKKRSFLEHIKR